MPFKEEDFPLYQLLIQLNEPGIERARAEFEKAVKGGDDEKFRFALGLQTCCINMESGAPDHTQIPGNTREINDRTLMSCLAVFREAAANGHQGAAFMVRDYARRGIGQPKKAIFPRFRF